MQMTLMVVVVWRSSVAQGDVGCLMNACSPTTHSWVLCAQKHLFVPLICTTNSFVGVE